MRTLPGEDLPAFVLELQDRLCGAPERGEPGSRFRRGAREWAEGGVGITRVVENVAGLERAGVAVSHVGGSRRPPAATHGWPALAGLRSGSRAGSILEAMPERAP